MASKHIKEKILYAVAIGISVFFLFFIVSGFWIGYEVKNQCNEAMNAYEGDCVEALIQTLEDENQDYSTRNDAIWALGQLGDIRALPVLMSYQTGDIPSREPYDKTISQYELKKAIRLTRGGINIPAFMWRGILD